MIIGDWSIDDAGKIGHLKCNGDPTWSTYHRCWIGYGYKTNAGFAAGHYVEIHVPEFVGLLSKTQYEIWAVSREPYRGKT